MTLCLLLWPCLALGANGFDQLLVADEGSARAHRLTVAGEVRTEVLDTALGATVRGGRVVTLTGRGAELSFEVAARAGQPLLLEVEEVHNRRPRAFGYQVLAGGQPVYFRSYWEVGSGPNHYFVQIPAACVAADGLVRVTLRSAGAAPFSVARVWAYADFDQLAADEQVYRKLEILFGLGTQAPRTKDPAVALAQAAAYQQRYGDAACYGPPGLMGIHQYGYDVRGSLRDALEFSAKSGLRTQMMLSGFAWGAYPQGPDGLGGWLTDVKYQQVVWDPVKQRYACAFGNPGLWTERMLAVQQRRYARAASFLVDRLAFMQAHGQAPPLPLLVREHGVEYPVNGDYNAENLARAARAGIELTPERGLTPAAKVWLNRNLTDYLAALADNTTATLGRSAVVVDRGEVRLPAEQLLDDSFSHPDCGAVWPEYDEQQPHWWTGVADGLFASGETGVAASPYQHAYYDYIRAQGKLGCVNQECVVLGNLAFLPKHYQQGFWFETFFGGTPAYRDWLAKVDHIDGQPALPPNAWDRRILDVNVRRNRDLGPALAVDNLRPDRITTDDISKAGSVTYRLDAVDGPFDMPLQLELELQTTPQTTVQVLAGPSPEKLEPVAAIPNRALTHPDGEVWRPAPTADAHVGLGRAMLGATTWYLKLVLPPKRNPAHDYILRVLVTQPWPAPTGHAAANPFTARQLRTMNLWVQERAMAERWLARYRALGGEDATWRQARELCAAGRYVSAKRLLAGEVSQLPPARFAVRGRGRLGRWPVEVQLDSEDDVVLVDLLKAEPLEVKLTAEHDLTCHFPGCGAERLGRNHYRLTPGPGASVPVTTTEERPALPRHFTTTFSRGGQGGIYVALQDPDLALDGDTFIPTAPDCKQTRRPDGGGQPSDPPWPQELDQVELTLNDAGQATEIRSTFGLVRGTVKSFAPPVVHGGEPDNGSIELADGQRFELGYGWPYKFLKLAGIGQYERDFDKLAAALAPGTQVEVRYCPCASPGRLRRAITIAGVAR